MEISDDFISIRRITMPYFNFRSYSTAALGLAVIFGAGQAQAADRDHPTVVELFQSQGCSSCPPANANVIALSDRPDLLTLSFGVTYWDKLGWKDTFGSPQYTARQWDYARDFHRREVATPEVVVNGRADVIGNRRDELENLIRSADRGDSGPKIALEENAVAIGAAQGHADVVLVRYDPNVVEVPIGRGENSGKTLPHKNVVKELTRLGAWTGEAVSFELPKPPVTGLKTAILLQDAADGAIIGAVRD
jgi:hypothetical protein